MRIGLKLSGWAKRWERDMMGLVKGKALRGQGCWRMNTQRGRAEEPWSGRGGGGRDRFRRDYPSRFEDKMSSHSGSGRNLNSNSNTNSNSNNSGHPASRHLWVGNLSHSILEHELTNHFLQFGELESVAFQPGRSYAFLNFKRDDDAFAAINALQGFPVAGNPLRIEFKIGLKLSGWAKRWERDMMGLVKGKALR
nr:isoform 2 of putative rna-binding protein 15b [Quercus suber]